MENMKILTSLDSLRESIEEKFGWENEESDERTIAEHMSSYCGPRIGYRFFVERIDDLKDLIESTLIRQHMELQIGAGGFPQAPSFMR